MKWTCWHIAVNHASLTGFNDEDSCYIGIPSFISLTSQKYKEFIFLRINTEEHAILLLPSNDSCCNMFNTLSRYAFVIMSELGLQNANPYEPVREKTNNWGF